MRWRSRWRRCIGFLYDVTSRERGDSVVGDSLCVLVSTLSVYKLVLRVPKTLSWVSCPRDYNSHRFLLFLLGIEGQRLGCQTERGLKTPSEVCFESCPTHRWHTTYSYMAGITTVPEVQDDGSRVLDGKDEKLEGDCDAIPGNPATAMSVVRLAARLRVSNAIIAA